MVRQVISAPDAPKAMGAYSPAIKAGNLLFVSGQIPIDPASGALIDGDITAQTEQVMRNLGALLRAAGAGFEHVVRTTVFLADMGDFAAMNEVYSRHVAAPPPARATVQVARLAARREDRSRRDCCSLVIQNAKCRCKQSPFAF